MALKAAPFIETVAVITVLGPTLFGLIDSLWLNATITLALVSFLLADLAVLAHQLATGVYVPDRRTGRFGLASVTDPARRR